MKNFKLLLVVVVGIAMAVFVTRAWAEDSDQTTLTGMLVCGKCKLHITDSCQNVLQVQKDGQTVNYFLAHNQVSDDFHDNICKNDGEKVTVTGTASMDNGTNMLTATKIEPAK
jgi:Family of unknown function (DUF6370)